MRIEELFIGAVTVGERGQVVIPAAARETSGIHPGDKLLSFYHPFGCGVTFTKIDQVQRMHQTLTQMLETMDDATPQEPLPQ